MNIYSRINAQAEAAKQRTRAAQDGWWKDRALWQQPGRAHSTTEFEAIDALIGDCPLSTDIMPHGLTEVRMVDPDRYTAWRDELPPMRADVVRFDEARRAWVFDLDVFSREVIEVIDAWRTTREKQQRAAQAYYLRFAHGMSFQNIAERLGYADKSGAEKAVSRLCRRIELSTAVEQPVS